MCVVSTQHGSMRKVFQYQHLEWCLIWFLGIYLETFLCAIKFLGCSSFQSSWNLSLHLYTVINIHFWPDVLKPHEKLLLLLITYGKNWLFTAFTLVLACDGGHRFKVHPCTYLIQTYNFTNSTFWGILSFGVQMLLSFSALFLLMVLWLNRKISQHNFHQIVFIFKKKMTNKNYKW